MAAVRATKAPSPVAVTVASGKITDVRIVSHADDAAYVERAEKLIPSILSQQTADVDTISGVTYSSKGIIAAVKDAMSGSGTVAITNSVWFGALMALLALALLMGAAVLAKRYLSADSRAQKLRLSRRQRWLVQGAFFVLAPSSFATGFMGLKTLLMQINVMNTHRGYDFEVMLFTVFLVLLLVLTVLIGRFFCGYVCASAFRRCGVCCRQCCDKETGHNKASASREGRNSFAWCEIRSVGGHMRSGSDGLLYRREQQ